MPPQTKPNLLFEYEFAEDKKRLIIKITLYFNENLKFCLNRPSAIGYRKSLQKRGFQTDISKWMIMYECISLHNHDEGKCIDIQLLFSYINECEYVHLHVYEIFS